MSDDAEPSRLDLRIDERIFHHFERIGVYAQDTPGLEKTRANFVAQNRLSPHVEDILDLIAAAKAEREARADAARAADEDRRERRNKRYEAGIGFLASIAQYGAAGALGYGVSWFLGHWRH